MAREADGAKRHQKEPTGSQMTDENHLARLVDLGIALSAEQGREELNQKILWRRANLPMPMAGRCIL